MHLRVIGNGLPVQIELSPGQMNDAPMAELLLNDLPAGAEVLADKGYDADWIRDLIEDQGCTPHIPPRSNRYDGITYSKNEIQEAQPYRTLLQQAQAVPTHRNPIRPQRSQLPRHDQNRLRPSLAQVL